MHDSSNDDPTSSNGSRSPGPEDSPEASDARPPAARLAWATATALREGDLEAAQRHCDAALALVRGAGHEAAVASVQTILGRVLRTRGDLAAAQTVLDAALDVQRRVGSEHPVANTLLELGALHATLGSLDEAHSAFLEALTHFARLKASVPEAQAQLGIAAVHHAAGRLSAARRHGEIALGVALQADDHTLRASCQEVLGAIAHESERRLRARAAFRDAAQAWHRLGDRPGEARCQLAVARLDLDADEVVQPLLDALEQDLAVQRQPWLMGRVACLRGVALGQAGDRLAYSVLAHGAALLDSHPAWRHLPAIEQGHLDLARGDDDAAYRRLGAVPPHALRSVQVRLALGSLRRRLGAALRAQGA